MLMVPFDYARMNPFLKHKRAHNGVRPDNFKETLFPLVTRPDHSAKSEKSMSANFL